MDATIQPFPLPSELSGDNATTTSPPPPSFPQPSELPGVIENTFAPFPLPNSLAPEMAANTTLSTTTVSRASRASFSPTAETTAAWTQAPRNTTDEVEWLLGGADEPWEGTFNSTFGNGTGNSTMEATSHNIFEERPWLIWLLVGIAAVTIICVIVIIVIVYLGKKKKQGPQGQAEAGTAENRRKPLMPCCSICADKPTRNVGDVSPKDAALNPYNRQPLPPIGASQSIAAGEMDGYQEGHLPAQRLAPLKRDSFDKLNSPHMFGANIQGLRGVPVIHVKAEDIRPLPQLD